MNQKHFYVYIMASLKGTLYVGVTNDLARRVIEHKSNAADGFTKRYNVRKLVHFEVVGKSADAIAREKQIKGWRRSKEVELIEAENPGWKDLSEEWFD